MPTPTCRCCGTELPYGRIEVLVSRERPRPNMHTSGRIVAASCDKCADEVVDCIHRAAQLWTPSQPCMHITGTLFA